MLEEGRKVLVLPETAAVGKGTSSKHTFSRTHLAMLSEAKSGEVVSFSMILLKGIIPERLKYTMISSGDAVKKREPSFGSHHGDKAQYGKRPKRGLKLLLSPDE